MLKLLYLSMDNIPRTTDAFRAPKTAAVTPAKPAESRRQQRYSRAEQALVSSLKQCSPEPALQELQIRALEQVTALLSAHARDARDRSAKLRESLGAKDTDPQIYIAMQKERWMEEKRQCVVDSEIKAVQDHLVSMNRFGRRSIARGDCGEIISKPMDKDARKRANLAKFFESSPTRTPISSRRSSVDQRAPRRVTMNDAPPMRLRTSIASTFTPYDKGHLRSISLDAKLGNRASTSSLTSRSSLKHPFGSTPLEIVAEVTGNSETSAVLPRSSIDMGVPTLSESMSDSAISTRSPTPPPSNSMVPSPGDGVAVIYTPAKLRSKAAILASMDDVQLQLPSYALDLMEDLDNLTIRQPMPFQTATPSANADSSSVLATPTRRKAAASTTVQESPEPSTPSRRRSIRSLGNLSRSRSLLRKPRPRPSSPPESPTKPSHSQNNRPLSNLFSISESSSSTTIPNRPARNSMLSLPFPRGRNADLNNTSTANIPTSSSQAHSSPSRLTRPFHLFGRRWNLGSDY